MLAKNVRMSLLGGMSQSSACTHPLQLVLIDGSAFLIKV